MKLFILGQGSGGNASLWLEKFEKVIKTDSGKFNIEYYSRTPLTIDTGLNVISPYGYSLSKSFLNKVRKKLVSSILFKYLLKIRASKRFDGIILQGNYTPKLNLTVLNELEGPSILNVYGSDFYRNYLKGGFSATEKDLFQEVLNRVDKIALNWETTKLDFLREFPHLESKVFVNPWGVNNKWFNDEHEISNTFGWPDAKKVFLSARGLYGYNNVSKVVESFCKAYQDKPDYKLFIVNGYGNDKDEISKVKSLIKRYGCEEKVILKINQWISDEELQWLYQRADYNFCFGSTDQLTVSICYGFLNRAQNILSPLENYKHLVRSGYSSPIISQTFETDDLVSLLTNLKEQKPSLLKVDMIKAQEEFNIDRTFQEYCNVLMSIKGTKSFEK